MVEIGITMAVKAPVKTVAALTALKALQEDAKRKGLDKMTMDEINVEIAAYRRERRAKAKSDPKAR
jgi:hypothetical protein